MSGFGVWKRSLDVLLAEGEKAVPDDLTPYYEAGTVLLDGISDLTRAERYFRKYLTQEPEGNEPSSADARRRLGLVLQQEGHL